MKEYQNIPEREELISLISEAENLHSKAKNLLIIDHLGEIINSLKVILEKIEHKELLNTEDDQKHLKNIREFQKISYFYQLLLNKNL